MKSRILLSALVLLGFALGAAPEAEAACYQCDNTNCAAYDTGSQRCSDGSECGPSGCVSYCIGRGGSCTGGCDGVTSPEGECLNVANKSALRVIPNGEALSLDFPPRHRFEPSGLSCDGAAAESSPSAAAESVDLTRPEAEA